MITSSFTGVKATIVVYSHDYPELGLEHPGQSFTKLSDLLLLNFSFLFSLAGSNEVMRMLISRNLLQM